jgi:regulator of cell morphogenesis and NO signaling
MNIEVDTPVGAIVAERLGRARVFERLGIDYCCEGATPLEDACSQRSLDVDCVVAEIADCDARDAEGRLDPPDPAAMNASELADIVETHHDYLRRELPRLSRLMANVLIAHGDRHPELAHLWGTLADLRDELESHMLKEERVLFPLIKRLEAAQSPFPVHCGTVENPIRVMVHEHESAGLGLKRIRELTGNHRPPADACASFKALYEGLAHLEADLHRHIHKENNILFPRGAALEAAMISRG